MRVQHAAAARFEILSTNSNPSQQAPGFLDVSPSFEFVDFFPNVACPLPLQPVAVAGGGCIFTVPASPPVRVDAGGTEAPEQPVSVLKISLQKDAMLEHMNQFGVDFFGFTWDDSVEVCASAHVCDAGPQDSDGEQTCSITRESPTQRVPWSPLSLDLMLQRGVTYFLAFNAQHHVASHALPSVQPDEMFTSHAKPYEAEDVPGWFQADSESSDEFGVVPFFVSRDESSWARPCLFPPPLQLFPATSSGTACALPRA